MTVAKYPNHTLVYGIEGEFPMIFNIDARGHELFPTGFYFYLLHVGVSLFIYLIQLLLFVLQYFRVIVVLHLRFIGFWLSMHVQEREQETKRSLCFLLLSALIIILISSY